MFQTNIVTVYFMSDLILSYCMQHQTMLRVRIFCMVVLSDRSTCIGHPDASSSVAKMLSCAKRMTSLFTQTDDSHCNKHLSILKAQSKSDTKNTLVQHPCPVQLNFANAFQAPIRL